MGLTDTLPSLFDPDTLIATQGLCHLNFHQPSEILSKCAATQCTTNVTETVVTCMGDDDLVGRIEGDLECISNENGPSANISGYNCACTCERMYLTFETFANVFFPILLVLGLYCLIDALLTHWKDKAKDSVKLPIAYRLAEQFPKEKGYVERRERRHKRRDAAEEEKRKKREAAATINFFVETSFVRQKVFG